MNFVIILNLFCAISQNRTNLKDAYYLHNYEVDLLIYIYYQMIIMKYLFVVMFK